MQFTLTEKYDPESWLVSAMRVLKEYITDGFHVSFQDDGGNPIGNNLWTVISEFPDSTMSAFKMPLEKSLVHLEIDDADPRLIGIGRNYFRDNYDEDTGTVNPQEAKEVRLNFDLGVWTSDKSGGITSRLKAYQILDRLFFGPKAIERLRTLSDGGDGGLEILDFTRGNFLRERVNDVTVYRIADMNLEIRVFTRSPLDADEAGPAIESIVQDPNLTIGGDPIT